MIDFEKWLKSQLLGQTQGAGELPDLSGIEKVMDAGSRGELVSPALKQSMDSTQVPPDLNGDENTTGRSIPDNVIPEEPVTQVPGGDDYTPLELSDTVDPDPNEVSVRKPLDTSGSKPLSDSQVILRAISGNKELNDPNSLANKQGLGVQEHMQNLYRDSINANRAYNNVAQLPQVANPFTKEQDNFRDWLAKKAQLASNEEMKQADLRNDAQRNAIMAGRSTGPKPMDPDRLELEKKKLELSQKRNELRDQDREQQKDLAERRFALSLVGQYGSADKAIAAIKQEKAKIQSDKPGKIAELQKSTNMSYTEAKQKVEEADAVAIREYDNAIGVLNEQKGRVKDLDTKTGVLGSIGKAKSDAGIVTPSPNVLPTPTQGVPSVKTTPAVTTPVAPPVKTIAPMDSGRRAEIRSRIVVGSGENALVLPEDAPQMTKEEAGKLRNEITNSQSTAREFDQIINQYDTFLRTHGIQDAFDSKTNQEYRALQSKLRQLGGKLRSDLVGPGAVTDAERAIIEEVLGMGFKELLTAKAGYSDPVQQLTDIRNNSVGRTQDSIDSHGLVPIRQYLGDEADSYFNTNKPPAPPVGNKPPTKTESTGGTGKKKVKLADGTIKEYSKNVADQLIKNGSASEVK